jgi:hypothetical protein
MEKVISSILASSFFSILIYFILSWGLPYRGYSKEQSTQRAKYFSLAFFALCILWFLAEYNK